MERVLILHSEVSEPAREDELDTLVQADAVEGALAASGYEVLRRPFSLERVTEDLRALSPDAVFNLVESVGGAGKLVHLAPSLLEARHIAHTGCPAAAVALQESKLITKRVLQGEALPTAPWCRVQDLGNGRFAPGEVYIVKSVWEHCSVGMDDGSVLRLEDRARAGTLLERKALEFGGEFFIERYVDGREFNLAVLGGGPAPRVLPPAEMMFENYPEGKPRIVGYAAKWDDGSFESCHTVRRYDFPESDRSLLDRLEEMARQCWQVFGLSGYARVDFRVDRGGQPWVLEVNANPCLSPDAGFAAAAQAAGMSYQDVIREIMRHLV